MVTLIIGIFVFSRFIPFTPPQESTMATWVTGGAYFWILFSLCYPFTSQRILLLTTLTGAFFFAMYLFAPLLNLVAFHQSLYIATGILVFITPFLLWGMKKVALRYQRKNNRQIKIKKKDP